MRFYHIKNMMNKLICFITGHKTLVSDREEFLSLRSGKNSVIEESWICSRCNKEFPKVYYKKSEMIILKIN